MPSWYDAARILAGVLVVTSAVLAAAANMPDLGLSRQQVAIVSLVQVALTGTIALLPRVQGDQIPRDQDGRVIVHRGHVEAPPTGGQWHGVER